MFVSMKDTKGIQDTIKCKTREVMAHVLSERKNERSRKCLNQMAKPIHDTKRERKNGNSIAEKSALTLLNEIPTFEDIK